MGLSVCLFTSATSNVLVADFSALIEEIEFGNDEHGFADCRLFVPGSLFDSFWLYDRSGLPHLRITDHGVLVWEGRVEDVKVAGNGIEMQALGYYRSLSDLPYTAAHASVTANTIVAALLASAPLLSSSTALIQSPGVTISESYDDEIPAEILDRLTHLGDSQTPPRIWEACVWENRMLAFRPRGDAARAWYVDVPELEVERTLQTLYNSAYGVYQDASNLRAVTATATDTPSVNRWGLTRREAVNAQTRDSALAAIVRDMMIEDAREPAVRAEVTIEAVYDAAGAAYPGHAVRSGDTLTLRNLPPTLAVSLNRIRTFRVLSAHYDPLMRELKITPESPPASIVEQLSGGPSHSPSHYSTPLRRMKDKIKKIEQEIHGGPGGGGTGSGGGSGGGSYLIPTGGILLFAGDCPATGWTEYTAARGRSIVGVPSGGTIAGTVGSALTNLGSRTISTTAAHTHTAGTLDGDNESAHTHGVGTLNNATESSHTHGAGTYDAAAEAAHTHAVNPPSTTVDDSGTHSHTASGNAFMANGGTGIDTYGVIAGDDPLYVTPTTNSGGLHGHTVDIASFTSGAGASHDHALSGSSGAGSTHDHAISGATAAGAAHGHTISGSTASAGTATVDVTMPYIQLRLCQKD